MSQSKDEYESGVLEIIQKITNLQTKIELIEFSTVFKTTAKNNSILLLDLIKILGKSGYGNPLQMVYRFIQIDRSLFVDTISAFEYEIRCFIQEESDPKLKNIQEKLQKNQMMSISKLICFLKDNDYLNDIFYKKLDGLFAIRNMIVHHNSIVTIAENRVSNEFQNMFSDFKVGKRMYGKPDMFLSLVEHLIDFYLHWYNDKPILKLIYKKSQIANHH